tara:strand:+ start:95 stop:328 length:234 start_codon:yes stop_codon:yes gene_type:complete
VITAEVSSRATTTAAAIAIIDSAAGFYSEVALLFVSIDLRPTLALLQEFTNHVPRAPTIRFCLEIENESVGKNCGRY